MKIWWQSVHDFEGDPESKPYYDRLTSVLNGCAASGNQVVIHGMRFSNPVHLEGSRWGHMLHGGQVPKLAMQAQREGYDAFCLGCTTDMGLFEAKEAVDIVVCGISEVNLHMAMLLGERFAYIAADEGGVIRLRHLAAQYGVDHRMVPCSPFSMPFEERYAAFADPARLISKMEPIAREAAKNGAGILLLSDNILNMVLRQHGITEIAGLPVQEGSSVLIKTAEMLLALDKLGVRRSKKAFPRIGDADKPWFEMASYAKVDWKKPL
jgi:Asp/Glu/hydantoin racemase